MLLRREPEPDRRAICALVAFHQQPSVPRKLTQLTQLAHTAEMSLQLLRAGFKPLPSFSPCPIIASKQRLTIKATCGYLPPPLPHPHLQPVPSPSRQATRPVNQPIMDPDAVGSALPRFPLSARRRLGSLGERMHCRARTASPFCFPMVETTVAGGRQTLSWGAQTQWRLVDGRSTWVVGY